MANDQSDSGDGKAPPDKKGLSEVVVEQVKSAILQGVGYKRPPERTRFKKGQSGNPAGRPKSRDVGLGGSRSANALALREAGRLISVREGEKVRQITAIEAVFRAQYASATRGNAYAQKHVAQRYEGAEREQRQHRIYEIEIWAAYVADQRQAIADAKAKKETPPTPLPHPDDVVIDYETGVRFIGPVNKEDAARLEENLRMRDVLIIQDALDLREADGPNTDDPLDRPGTAMLFAQLINRGVPERHRLSEIEFQMRTMRYASMPKRVLLKQLYRDWRTLGARYPRGFTFPSLRVGKLMVEEFVQALANIETETAG